MERKYALLHFAHLLSNREKEGWLAASISRVIMAACCGIMCAVLMFSAAEQMRRGKNAVQQGTEAKTKQEPFTKRAAEKIHSRIYTVNEKKHDEHG